MGMGGLSQILQNNPELLAQLQGGRGQPPGGTGQSPGVLGMLPQGHQQAANAPPPVPPGQLGPYSQQALGMAGVSTQAPDGGAIGGGMPPGGGMPGRVVGMPGGGMGGGMGGGKGGGTFGGHPAIPGLLERLR